MEIMGAAAISSGCLSLHSLTLGTAALQRISQAEGRDGTFQDEIGTRIRSMCPTLAHVAHRRMSRSLWIFFFFFGGGTEVQMRDSSVEPQPLEKCCMLFQSLVAGDMDV